MHTFLSLDGLAVAYDDNPPPGPAERTIVLVHGFSSNRGEGWKRTGWYAAFERRGFRVIALDLRGHGQSGKPHDPAAYTREAMSADILGLMDHLGVDGCALFGYSMGARLSLSAAMAAPGRFSHLILGGVGASTLRASSGFRNAAVAQAMLAESLDDIPEPMMRTFRRFADAQGEDRLALAALSNAPIDDLDPADLAPVGMPVLVVAGEQDTKVGDPAGLAAAFAHGRAVVLPGCDHFTAIPHASTKAAVFDFLDGLLDDPFPSPF